jgi:hypothetical protein
MRIFKFQKAAAFEFDYGVQYAWILTVFTIVLSYSVVCPLIAPFGLFYMILKHIVDRYNIYFAYVATKVDKEIHKSAVTFCIFSLLMLQLCILFFIAIRNEGSKISTMTIIQILVICITFSIYFGRLFFGLFKKFSPFNSKKKRLLEDVEDNREKGNNNETFDDDDDYDEDNEDNREIERVFSISKVLVTPDNSPISTNEQVEVRTIQPSSSVGNGLNDELANGSNKYNLKSVKSKKEKKQSSAKRYNCLLESVSKSRLIIVIWKNLVQYLLT